MKTAATLLTVMAGTLAVVLGAGQGVDRTIGGSGGPPTAEALAEIPPHLLTVYQQAASTCSGLPWQILAAIGWAESRHGSGRIDPDTGQTVPPILGPALDGSGIGGNRTPIPDPSMPGGWARAIGPMQFLSTTFRAWAVLAPGRSEAAEPDPQNAWDASFTAARYLCGGKPAITDLRGAIFRYNHSQAYVSSVIDKATRYGLASSTPPDGILLATVRGITVNARIADRTAALVAAAENDGIRLTGGGYRSHQQQITLRRAHCGPTTYDIYQRPAGQCSPPTARPGQSFQEQGLAIDFTCEGHLIVSRRDPCFLWLDANAHRFGFTGIRSEAWHWEVRAG